MTDLLDRVQQALADRYTIEREIGSGGMATVYLAEDVKHQRQVAVKVLRPELAAVLGAERFLNEIKVTANLQHPHLLPLFDSGQADSFLYYVMPYVEGESLRDKLNREKQLSIEEAVQITAQVAAALDYAHRHDVIHRDIKPENILLHDGQALVADFGIALAVRAAGGDRLTETGLSLGTPQYMSPEQATADRELDGRADVYALGVVLYEMLSGHPPFSAGSAQAIVTKILTETPAPIAVERPSVPAHVDAALQAALAKLPADRFPTASDFAEAITRPGVAPYPVVSRQRPVETVGRLRGLVRTWPTAVAGAVVVLAAGILLGRGIPLSQERPTPPVRFRIRAPPTLVPGPWQSLALSPDGQWLVFVGISGQVRQLHLRAMTSLETVPIEGTERASTPFFSPDGEWIGYVADGQLQKVQLSGGAPVVITDADANVVRGASWGSNHIIVFTPTQATGLWQVPASGGDPTQITTPGSGQAHRWPDVLPGGRAAVFTILGSRSDFQDAAIGVATLGTGKVKRLVEGAIYPRYVDSGHLVYVANGSVLAVPFDAQRLELMGAPIPVLERVSVVPGGVAHLAVSHTGTLAYLPRVSPARSLVMVDRMGEGEALAADPLAYSGPAVSPDGSRLAVAVETDAGADLWIFDLRHGTMSPLTFEASNRNPFWSHDGRRVTFASNAISGAYDLLWIPADASGPPEPLIARAGHQISGTWSSDGASLVYCETNPATGDYDLWAFRFGGNGESRAYLQTPANEHSAALSPDGSWLAYVSDESGRDEVYVRAFPAGGARQQVSVDGGRWPQWAPSGRELFYEAEGYVVSATVTTDGEFGVESRDKLFELSDTHGPFGRDYAVHPDGDHFVVAEGEARGVEVVVVVNGVQSAIRIGIQK